MSSASWPTLSSTKIVGDYDAGLDYGVPSGLMGLLQIQGGKSGSRVIVLPGGHIRGLAQLWDALEPRAITMDGCSRALSPLNRCLCVSHRCHWLRAGGTEDMKGLEIL